MNESDGLDTEREAALERTRQAYRRYESGSQSRRWAAREPGSRLALEERNAWLVQALAGRNVVLDIGCGDGNLALTLDRAGVRPAAYIGTDLLPERIDAARSRVPWGTFHVGSADSLPLGDASVDAVAAVTTLSSIPAELLPAVAAEIARVLMPGGRLVVYDMRYRSPGNPDVHPVRSDDLSRLFRDWPIRSRTMTLLPPLARSALGGSPRRYGFLTSLPWLRSHAGSVLTRP